VEQLESSSVLPWIAVLILVMRRVPLEFDLILLDILLLDTQKLKIFIELL
jgi:hypothetical protein